MKWYIEQKLIVNETCKFLNQTWPSSETVLDWLWWTLFTLFTFKMLSQLQNAIVIFWTKESQKSVVYHKVSSILNEWTEREEKNVLCKRQKFVEMHKLNEPLNIPKKASNANWMKWSHYKNSKCIAFGIRLVAKMCNTHFHFHVHFYQFVFYFFFFCALDV